MNISITNGTLTQVQETLSPASGYTLPASVTVTGATSSYSSSTGVLTLTSSTSAMTVTASGVSPTPTPSSHIKIGNLDVEKMYFGNLPIQSVYLGNIKIYGDSSESKEPTIISFTIDGTEYQAEEGMDWADWCDSEYNTDGFVVSNDNNWIYSDNQWNYYVSISTVAVLKTDEIIENQAYTLYNPGEEIGGGGK